MLLRAIDPIEWYMAKSDEHRLRQRRTRRRSRPFGWTAYVPLEVEGGHPEASRPQSPPPREREGLKEHAVLHEALQAAFGPYFETKARELLTDGRCVIETTGGTVRARLVRFRNGAVFEHATSSPGRSGRGHSRIDRPQLTDPVPLLVGYLVHAVVDLGGDPRPGD